MAKNQIYADIESLRRVVTVPTGTAPGTALIDAGRPAVTLTGSGDYVNTDVITAGDQTVTVATTGGGIGLDPLQAVVTYTGSFSFPVVGATSASAGEIVYYDTVAADGTLTLTATSNTAFGVVDFFRGEDSSTDTVVKIGVAL